MTEVILKEKYLPQLQSLRGIAAILVLASHCLTAYELPVQFRVAIDAVLNAHAAVILFFVLSGYVLSLSLQDKNLNKSTVFAFYTRRVFRIFPAVWIASCVGLVYVATLHGYPVATSNWFRGYFKLEEYTVLTIILSCFALKNFLIPPLGTIFVELVGSAFLPLMLRIKRNGRFRLPLLLVLFSLSIITVDSPWHLESLGYLFEFGLGMFLADKADSKMKTALAKIHPRMLFLGALIVLLFFRALWEVVTYGTLQPIVTEYRNPYIAVVEGLSAYFLLAPVVLNPSAFKMFKGKVITYLGDISYGIYLLHFPLMAINVALLDRYFGPTNIPSTLTLSVILVVITFVTSVIFATILYKVIELPGILLGKKVSRAVIGN